MTQAELDLVNDSLDAEAEASRAEAEEAEAYADAFTLTADNYHSDEANRRFMSHSQYKSWLDCAAREFAIQQGEYSEPERPVFLGGRYAHVYFLEAHKLEAFEAAHPEIRKTKDWTTADLKAFATEQGIDLKGAMASKAKILERMEEIAGYKPPEPPREWGTDFKWVPNAIAAFERQEVFLDLLQRGRHEVVITFEIGGVPWRAMIDNLREDDHQFDDLKFMRDLEDSWSKELKQYVHWYEQFDYDQQAAVYREATRQHFGIAFRPNILAATKQDPADVDWIQFKHTDYLDAKIATIAGNMDLISQWKAGEQEPPRCGKASCQFCRASKTITRPRIPIPR
jgi:hypothetical protein